MSTKMTSLAAQFPALEKASGIKPWDPLRLDEWAITASSGERHAAAFILHVWNAHNDWKVGKFDVMDALWTWDRSNREAFVKWAQSPYWV